MRETILTAAAAALIFAATAEATTVEKQAIRATFRSDPAQAECIAGAESSLHADAVHRNPDGSVDRGLFQINSVWIGKVVSFRLRRQRVWIRVSSSKLFRPLYNARVAWAISHGGNAWGPWSSFTVHGLCRGAA